MSSFTRVADANPHGFSLQQTMLRIKDPKKSIDFYKKNFGFTLIHSYDFPQWTFALHFLAILPDGMSNPVPGTKESEEFLWNLPMGVSTLELTHNYGSENDDTFQVNNGNVEPARGFGHIAVMTPDVYAASDELDKLGVRFQKKPDEGRMKGIAFALDPDNYWIEIVSRGTSSPVTSKYSLAQTMMRVKDPKASLDFFCNKLKMSLLRESHYSDFSLYFLASLPSGTELPDKDSPEASEYIKNIYPQVLELTHNHGTENNEDFSYHNGNDQDGKWQGVCRGFGHIGYLVDDLEKACDELEQQGVLFKKRPSEGTMRGLAFAYSPIDNYWIEIIQRKGLKMI